MIANSSRRRRTLFCRGNRKKGARGRKEEAARKFPTRGRIPDRADGGAMRGRDSRAYLRELDPRWATWQILPTQMPNHWRVDFREFGKILGCQVQMPNRWRCSYICLPYPFAHVEKVDYLCLPVNFSFWNSTFKLNYNFK